GNCADLRKAGEGQLAFIPIGVGPPEIFESSSLREVLSRRKAEIASCRQLSVVFMPSSFQRCAIKIDYDSELKVTGKTEPSCYR
ncbi:MAG TPA: hypothetical protein VM598_07670, partial [Bdellovibrionota bacterium]|nr:hypothetical protein [Bdellovibrionota bacterium]